MLVRIAAHTICSTMRRKKEVLRAVAVGLVVVGTILSSSPLNVQAESTNGSSLIISQLKITSSNGQFITLYNSSNNGIDMSKYQLEYFNNYDLSKATSSRLVALTGVVAPHGYFMISDDSLLLCYKMTVNSVSLGLSSTAGLVQVLGLNQSVSGGAVAPIVEDYVSWSRASANGAQTLPANVSAFLQRNIVDGSWSSVQRDSNNPCNLVSTINGISVSGSNIANAELLSGGDPPATFVGTNDTEQPQVITTASLGIPASDIGLMVPKITEVMPNPVGTGNDSTSEFIELYNPNPVPFDLSGFGLQSGITSLHNYIFPAGTSLPPLSFTAFYSSKTALSLSNSNGQAKLLDPSGNGIATTALYVNAKDGESWSLADGKWFWTTSVTPNSANIIKVPPMAKKSKIITSKTTKTKTKAAKIAKDPKIKPKSKSSNGFLNASEAAPIHVTALALVGSLALLYVAYEYRADLANYYFKFRSNFTTRFRDRP